MDVILGLKIVAIAGAIMHFVLVVGNGAYASTIGMNCNKGKSIRLHQTVSRWNIVVLAMTLASIVGATWHVPVVSTPIIYFGAVLFVAYATLHLILNGLRHRMAHVVVAMVATVASFFFIACVAATFFPA